MRHGCCGLFTTRISLLHSSILKGFFAAILAPAVSILAAWFASRWIAERLGGYTGDTLGAVQQKAEMAFLIVAALMIHH